MKYPFLPLRDFVVLPGQRAVLFFGRKKSVKSIEFAIENNKSVVVSLQTDSHIDSPNIDDINRIGVVAAISQLTRLTDGTYKAVLEGNSVFKIEELVENDCYFVHGEEVREKYDWKEKVVEVEALTRDIIKQFQIYVKLEKSFNIEDLMDVIANKDPFKLCYGIFSKLKINAEKKQQILLKRDIIDKLEYTFSEIFSEIEILRVNKRIQAISVPTIFFQAL